jgi:predicted nucleotidyltransferase
MGLSDYIEVYDKIEAEDDPDALKNMAKYLLVGRAMSDKNISEDEAIALAEYACCDMGIEEEGIVIH